MIDSAQQALRIIGYQAKQLRPRNSGDYDELFSAGLVGAAKGLRDYRESKGSLGPYLARRIRGAMIDYLRVRNGGGLGRAIRLRKKMLADLRRQAGDTPSESEEAAIAEVQRQIDAMPGWNPPSSIEAMESQFEDSDHRQQILTSQDPPPTWDWWEFVLRGLPRRQKLLLKLRFQAGFTLRECGRVIGVTEAMAYFLEKRALASIKERLSERPEAAAVSNRSAYATP